MAAFRAVLAGKGYVDVTIEFRWPAGKCALEVLYKRWPKLGLALEPREIRWRSRLGLRAIASLPVIAMADDC